MLMYLRYWDRLKLSLLIAGLSIVSASCSNSQMREILPRSFVLAETQIREDCEAQLDQYRLIESTNFYTSWRRMHGFTEGGEFLITGTPLACPLAFRVRIPYPSTSDERVITRSSLADIDLPVGPIFSPNSQVVLTEERPFDEQFPSVDVEREIAEGSGRGCTFPRAPDGSELTAEAKFVYMFNTVAGLNVPVMTETGLSSASFILGCGRLTYLGEDVI